MHIVRQSKFPISKMRILRLFSGVPEKPTEGPGKGHRINYNERFNFDGPQGRIGFGRYCKRHINM